MTEYDKIGSRVVPDEQNPKILCNRIAKSILAGSAELKFAMSTSGGH